MILFTQEQILERVKSLALEVSYKDNQDGLPVVMICVLNGAFMFFSDLVRDLQVDCEVDFIQAKSYIGQTQDEVRILKDINIDITDKNVYIVDDIYDSGNTMKCLLAHLKTKQPAKLTPVTLFKRSFSNLEGLLYGFELNSEFFLVGYGLDGKGGFKRNQPYITGDFLED